MIVILKYNEKMQREIKNFILTNMKNELNVKDSSIFKKITCDLEDIDKYYIKTGGTMLFAYDLNNHKVVGTIGLKINNNISILKRFYVKKEYRGQKIGFLLYQNLEQFIIEKKIPIVYLTTGDELKNAHNFYKKNGWILETSKTKIYVRKGAKLYKKEFKEVNSNINFMFTNQFNKIKA